MDSGIAIANGGTAIANSGIANSGIADSGAAIANCGIANSGTANSGTANSGTTMANSGIANSGIVIVNSGKAIENFHWMSIIILPMALHSCGYFMCFNRCQAGRSEASAQPPNLHRYVTTY